jgi:hypothetical protein
LGGTARKRLFEDIVLFEQLLDAGLKLIEGVDVYLALVDAGGLLLVREGSARLSVLLGDPGQSAHEPEDQAH